MKVVSFRPYKRWGDIQLLNKVFETYKALRENKEIKDVDIELCNTLILEAKARKLSCPKELMYKNIISK